MAASEVVPFSESNLQSNSNDAGHYVVTSHPPGGVELCVKCSFLEENSLDVIIAKSRHLEVRQLPPVNSGDDSNDNYEEGKGTSLPLIFSTPINGRITILLPFRHPSSKTHYLFFATDNQQYAILSYAPGLSSSDGNQISSPTPSPNEISDQHHQFRNIVTHTSGNLNNYGKSIRGKKSECGPLGAIEPNGTCIALQLYDGFITIIPIHSNYDPSNTMESFTVSSSPTATIRNPSTTQERWKKNSVGGEIVGHPFDCRIEERTILSMTFLLPSALSSFSRECQILPQLAFLHQDARGLQHVIAHSVDISRRAMVLHSEAANTGSEKKCKAAVTTINASRKRSVPPPIHDRLKKSSVEGGSGWIIPVPPIGYCPRSVGAGNNMDTLTESQKMPRRNETGGGHDGKMGGVLILGSTQITYHSTLEGSTKVVPVQPSLFTNCIYIDPPPFPTNARISAVGMEQKEKLKVEKEETVSVVGSVVQFLLSDEKGRLHVLAITRTNRLGCKVSGMHLLTLGDTNVAKCLAYLRDGIVFVGSTFSDSQLIQIMDQPILNSTFSSSTTATVSEVSNNRNNGGGNNGKDRIYIDVLEEYINLGPILDFDLVPTTHSWDGENDGSMGMDGNNGAFHSASFRETPKAVDKQSMVITASGAGKDGSIRIIRNGVGMSEHAAVELGGIKGMWNIRRSFNDLDDTFIIQSYVGETRVLGVVLKEEEECIARDGVENMDEGEHGNDSMEGGEGTLEEVYIPSLDSARSTLYAGNVSLDIDSKSSLLIQVTEFEIRVIDILTTNPLCTWCPGNIMMKDVEDNMSNLSITVAAANEAGQIVVTLRGGVLIYLTVIQGNDGVKIFYTGHIALDREISCIDLNPFTDGRNMLGTVDGIVMDLDGGVVLDGGGSTFGSQCHTLKSQVVAIGLWDDFSVRLLSLDSTRPLRELLRINLGQEHIQGDNHDTSGISEISTNQSHMIGQHMMARSLCLVTLDSTSSAGTALNKTQNSVDTSASASITNRANMILVGLGDGRLISFAVSTRSGGWSVHSRKVVSLGTRGVNLVPFRNHASFDSGTCVLATGDRPTVIYLAGGDTGCTNNTNPKLCFSNVNLKCGQPDSECYIGNGRERLVVNVATPFYSSVLFDIPNSSTPNKNYCLCVSDESTLRLGMIDDIQKLHVSTHKLGMAPRRIAYHERGRVICVGCIDDGGSKTNNYNGTLDDEVNMGNCIRFFDDNSFEEINRLDMDPFEMILSIISTQLKVSSEYSTSEKDFSIESKGEDNLDEQDGCYRSYLVVGTAYIFPDEDEPSRGRILIIQCTSSNDFRQGEGAVDMSSNTIGSESNTLSRKAVKVVELQTKGAVYSLCPFYDGTILATINSKTRLYQLVDGGSEMNETLDLKVVGHGHHGHILSLCVRSRVSAIANQLSTQKEEKEQIAIVGDLMRSIAVLRFYPKYQSLEEVARDFNQNWTTAIEMLSDNIYLGGENFCNLFVLRRNPSSKSEEVRCRLDTIGLFNLGEMPNKFMSGTLVMPSSSYNNSSDLEDRSSVVSDFGGKVTQGRICKPKIKIGSKTLFGTVDGTLGTILGLDAHTVTFFAALERAMSRIIQPIGNLKHDEFRMYRGERSCQPSRGFVDGDLVESFLDLDHATMGLIVSEMNREGRWEIDDHIASRKIVEGDSVAENFTKGNDKMLTINNVLTAVEEISMFH